MSWEDKLIGYPFTVVTDHESLKHFKTQPKLSPRQARWYSFLSRFDYETLYIDGDTNTVADAFSRYYHSLDQNEKVDIHEYVKADRRLDPEGEELPVARFIEVASYNTKINPSYISQDVYSTYLCSSSLQAAAASRQESSASPQESDDPYALEATSARFDLSRRISSGIDLSSICKWFYDEDNVLKFMLESKSRSQDFTVQDGLIRTKNRLG